MISIGSEIPAVNVTVVTPEGQEAVVASELFAGKKVVLFAVPGAFTPTCSAHHLPGYVVLADEIKAKGVDMIACISVNDAFVMKTWGEQQNAEAITMIADGGAAFTKALGLTMETGDFGGTRSQRYAMIIEDGKVTTLNVEEPKQFEVSKAETILAAL
ncbi:peroxiredoxin [Neptunomonas phycophila]|jgi:peroxiredoxin|uniref:peroxiredoxin n=1 Tax=Neptunomonas phycophila TaxID=1572645 RepID=UPI000948EC8C|nr:peroxiredoxin [Neptunomonas phycophila]MBT3146809.1 peroxiredoxin [Neptunomonas phycophila]MDO6467744.1 peroxiredoxin [Neptunomonas phycophila]